MASASSLASLPTLRIGPVEVRPGTREVIGPGGNEVVEPRVMQVLVCLIEARGEIVTRDALVERCWDGRAVSEDAINRVIARIRRLASEAGGGSFAIKTVHKVGYRLIDAPPEPGRTANAATAARHLAAPATRRWLPIGLVIVAGLLLALLIWRQSNAATPPTLAILPFRASGPTDTFFAAGVSEEIADQLVQDGGVRVVGRSAAPVPVADARTLGRQLGAAHLLEGSVRSAGDRMRITVSLVRTADGVRMWSRSFDGRHADALDLQQRIGAAVGAALSIRLAPRPRAAAVRGDAVRLYLTARGLLRSREQAKTEPAISLLLDAVRIDPNYALAWAALGKARLLAAGEGGGDAQRVRREAIAALDTALRLSPDLAEAHAAIALAHGFRGPVAAAHIARAARLRPADAEAQFWLGHALGWAGKLDLQLLAYRRAAELDPLWGRASWHAARLAIELGHDDQARAIEARVRASGDARASLALATHLAVARGDLSAALANYARLERLGPIRDGALRHTMLEARRLLGLLAGSRHAGFAYVEESRAWKGEAPAIDQLLARGRAAELVDQNYLESGAKALLVSGNGAPLAALFDAPSGLLGWSASAPIPLDIGHFQTAPTVALVLRQARRAAAAERVLASGERAAALLPRTGRLPPALLVARARLWAVAGARDRALAALDQAIRRGWLPHQQNDRADLRAEPAFASLMVDPRFDRLCQRLADRIARERREALILGV
jgi:TolB-like protein/DNA-binding winged helix-turn-helix (wHTH) protein